MNKMPMSLWLKELCKPIEMPFNISNSEGRHILALSLLKPLKNAKN